MKRAKTLLISLLLLSIATSCTNHQSRQQEPEHQTQIIAHRGFWRVEGSYENSISALQNAQRERFFGSELDVHITRDGVLVVNHDDDFRGIDINTHTYEELQVVRLPNGETIPTLRRHLELAAEHPYTRLIIEIKYKDDEEIENRTVAATLRLVEEMNMQHQVEYISFSRNICREIKRLAPDATVVFLSNRDATVLTPQELEKMGFSGFSYHFNLIRRNPHWVAEAQELGLTTNVWTVNDEDIMREMLALGVDFITTSNPLKLREIIESGDF